MCYLLNVCSIQNYMHICSKLLFIVKQRTVSSWELVLAGRLGTGVTDGLMTQRKGHLCVQMIPRHQVECPQLLEIPVIGQTNLVAGVGSHCADNLQVL